MVLSLTSITSPISYPEQCPCASEEGIGSGERENRNPEILGFRNTSNQSQHSDDNSETNHSTRKILLPQSQCLLRPRMGIALGTRLSYSSLMCLKGGGGGGFYTSGRSSKAFGGLHESGGEGGRGFGQGGTGGRAQYHNADGGFGGGGGGQGDGGGAGGGGGYSGGASGYNLHRSCGGGGGSYNIGEIKMSKQEVPTGLDGCHGYVEIKLLA